MLIAFAGAALLFNSCSKDELKELYTNPGQSSTATVENFLTGVFRSANEVVLPWYWRFFVVEQPTLGHYTQTMGWLNAKDQYIPPAQAMSWRWDRYYDVVTQFRSLEQLYEGLEDGAKAEYRIFYLAAKVFFYDQTQQVVDLYGDIPFSEAGRVRQFGNLEAALPAYDNALDIYNSILDDLKLIADELATITVPTFYANLFKTKDYLNNGDIMLWRKYCNSLRLRMLLRASDVLANRTAEIGAIFSDPAKYPVITSNSDDIMLDAGGPDLYATTSSRNGGIRQAMETWGQYDIAPYSYVKHMVDNVDPRLPAMFDPNVNGEYLGLNQMLDATAQQNQLTEGLISRYDTSSFTRNDLFPGMVISAAEVSFIKAEAIHRGFASGNAQEAYETGVRQSILFWYEVNSTGTYRAALPAPTDDEINAYLAGSSVSWAANTNKLKIIGEQKWLNTGLGQMTQTWSEMRRLDFPVLEFLPDNASISGQTHPPLRWLYPDSEKNLNGDNYAAVQSKDNLNQKIFWDTK